MYKEDLALNNLQWLIYHKTQPKQSTSQRTIFLPLLFFVSLRWFQTLMKGILDMTLKCIWWWGSCSGDPKIVQYPFIVTTARGSRTCKSSICESNRFQKDCVPKKKKKSCKNGYSQKKIKPPPNPPNFQLHSDLGEVVPFGVTYVCQIDFEKTVCKKLSLPKKGLCAKKAQKTE